MNRDTIHKLMKNPIALARYHATGKLPQNTPIIPSPLETILRNIPSHFLSQIKGLTVNPGLGYHTQITFPLNNPAESRRIRHFQQPLYLEDIATSSSQFPEKLFENFPHLSKKNLQSPSTSHLLNLTKKNKP